MSHPFVPNPTLGRDALADGMRVDLARLLEAADARADKAAGPKLEGFAADWYAQRGKHHALALEDELKNLRLRWPNQEITWRRSGVHEYLFRALGRGSSSTSDIAGAIRNWIAAEEKAERAAASHKAHAAADAEAGADAA